METSRRLQNKIFFDDRGSFSPLSLKTLEKNWIQSNISYNPKKFTLRGLHFQKGNSAQSKLIKVINGKILDFVFDMRDTKESKTLEFFEMGMGDEIIVPRGYAHGFITLEKDTVVQYLVDNDYKPSEEGVVVWTSFPQIENEIKSIVPEFEIDMVIISEKDLVEK